MLAEAPAGETIEINWLTSAQQWAMREVVAAGIELRPYGPVMVRGMDGPPSPTSRAAGTAKRSTGRAVAAVAGGGGQGGGRARGRRRAHLGLRTDGGAAGEVRRGD